MASNISEVERQLRRLFRRCVQCPPMKLDCPACKDGEVCVQQADDCDVCASVSCVPVAQSGATESSQISSNSNNTDVAAIAGGVIGGIAGLALITFLVWWFLIRKKRDDFVEYEEEVYPQEKEQFTLQRDARASTHTVASFASTVLTRASNVIQIAYIPGVTNRSGPGSPGLLVPPVPPIPIPTSGSNTPNASEDLHFLPGDIRDTMYSDMSDIRSSYAPSAMTRNSVATERYRQSAVLSPTPATTVMRGRPAIVSVKSSANTPTIPHGTPPVPAVGDISRFDSPHGSPKPAVTARPVMVKMPSSTDTTSSLARSGSLGKGAAYGKPTPLTIVKKKKTTTPPSETADATPSVASPSPVTSPAPVSSPQGLGLAAVRPLTEISVADTVDSHQTHDRARRPASSVEFSPRIGDESEDDDFNRHSRSRRSLLRVQRAADPSPFADGDSSPELGSPNPSERASPGGLTTVIEEAVKRASHVPRSDNGQERMGSPFGDENRVN